MNKLTQEVFLNCQQQGFLDYLIESYYIINIQSLSNQSQGERASGNASESTSNKRDIGNPDTNIKDEIKGCGKRFRHHNSLLLCSNQKLCNNCIKKIIKKDLHKDYEKRI